MLNSCVICLHTLIAQDSTHNAQPQNANSKNALIKGDNLEVLKHLKNAYYRKVKMIYIDPPYNTGNGDFIYNDERSFTPQSLAQMANIEIEEASSILNLTLKNSSTHSAWLSFMYPRLYIARQLLRDDGVIFISIDDNEQANLKLLCDEIFGEDNFVANIIWHSKNKPSGNTTENKTIDTRTEHILCYQKSYFLANKYENTKDELKEKGYILKDEFFKTRGYYKLTPLMHSCSASSFKYIESLDYEVKAPDGTIFKNHQNIKKPKSYCYTWSKKLFDFGNANGFIEIQKTSDGFWCIYRKMYEFCAIDNKKLEIVYRKSGNAYNNLITGI
ncbi:type III R-M system modification enzyme [Helicobacter fennelliae]|nr:site-specific DNA-methyltransferase [Helicobacter fennelliae]STQ83975.1 type III R-M system modification enzyme [Helicobacter fennelliae]